MTLLVVILLGAGTLLIISAWEDTSLVQTFTDILAGKPVVVKDSAAAGGAGSAGSF